ncbi:hypothetical protein IAT38_001728 [Cryptococcus sp. DSM 104549]
MSYLDIRELNELMALAGRGGIGRGVALTDCVAEAPDQLMYIQNDELILLRDLGEVLLASCEGVVGWVRRGDVKFEGVASSSVGGVGRGTPVGDEVQGGEETGDDSGEEGVEEGESGVWEMVDPVPRTVLTAPSPPPSASPPHSYPTISPDWRLSDVDSNTDTDAVGLEEPQLHDAGKRISGPFELDSPFTSPALGNVEKEGFFGAPSAPSAPVASAAAPQQVATPVKVAAPARPPKSHRRQTLGGSRSGSERRGSGGSGESGESGMSGSRTSDAGGRKDMTPGVGAAEGRERSGTVTSAYRVSSEGFGDIGGFMMDQNSESEDDHWKARGDSESSFLLTHACLALTRDSTEEHSPMTPPIITPSQSTIVHTHSPTSPVSSKPGSTTPPAIPTIRSLRPESAARNAADNEDSGGSSAGYESDPDWDIYGDYARESMYGPSARLSAAVQSRRQSRKASRLGLPGGAGSWGGSNSGGSEGEDGEKAISKAWAALQGIKPGEKAGQGQQYSSPITPPGVAGVVGEVEGEEARLTATELRKRIMREQEAKENGGDQQRTPEAVAAGHTPNDTAGNAEHQTITFTAPSPSATQGDLPPMSRSTSGDSTSLLASPLALDEVTPTSHSDTDGASSDGMPTPKSFAPPRHPNFSPSPSLSPAAHFSPQFGSPVISMPTWTPGSPASPHSIAATRQAVEVSREASARDGRRPRGLTLVGRMDADLQAAKGPVPITFLVNGQGIPVPELPPTPSTATGPACEPIGLGLPSVNGRFSPGQHPVAGMDRRATSPMILGEGGRPHPTRSVTSPTAAPTAGETSPLSPTTPTAGSPGIGAGAIPGGQRPRSRSFSSSVAKSLGVGRKGGPELSINTAHNPVPSLASPLPQSASSKKSFFSSRKASLAPHSPPPHSPAKSSLSRVSNAGSTVTLPHYPGTSNPNDSALSLPHPPASAQSASFSFSSKSSKTPRGSKGLGASSRALPSPVSHKDFAEEIVKMDGMDFELVQPKKTSTSGLLSPSDGSLDRLAARAESMDLDREVEELKRQPTMASASSSSSLRPLPETDEWGFLKHQSPTPEIFQSRSAPGDHRAIEGKWLAIIGTPLLSGSTPPKKVRKLVLEAGVPNSLRGRVWAWFMAGTLSARVPGLYQELLEHDRGREDERIERDVTAAYPDHSVFSEPNSPGQQDLRSILRAYSNFAPAGYRPEMALIAGALLIHCVAEDSFWLLSGLVNTVLKDFYGKERLGLRVEAAVFQALVQREEGKLGKMFKDTGLHPISFLDKWFSQLFIRCLPWPTTLRVIDAVVCEGPRFLIIASLTIMTLSRDRLLRLPQNSSAVLGYLQNIPQDSLLLPENFMKACEAVKFDEKDYKKMRAAAEKEVGVKT